MRGELEAGGELVHEVHHGQRLVLQRQADVPQPQQRRAGLPHHAEEGGLCPQGAADHERAGELAAGGRLEASGSGLEAGKRLDVRGGRLVGGQGAVARNTSVFPLSMTVKA